MKKNCWEVKGCGQQRGGRKNSLLKCPVPEMTTSDGINGGKYAGRVCWLIANTMCKGENATISFEDMIKICIECDFYKLVKEEEGKALMFSIEMLRDAYEKNKVERSNRRKSRSKNRF